MKWLKRAGKVAGFAGLAVVALAFVVVQFQQELLEWRAERLMADMHRIRLYQSDWADAQRLMSRWGAWGHYDGSCTEKDCRYSIKLTDASDAAYHWLKPDTYRWVVDHGAYVAYRWLGGRSSEVYLAFVVQDGKILRTDVFASVLVPPRLFHPEEEGYALMILARSQQALRDTEEGGSVYRDEGQLAQHPYYTAGRPGGCTFCMMVEITYATHAPQEEIELLTSFDLSCLTRTFSCKMPEDLLPAARPWHIYHDDELYAIDQQSKSLPPKACDIPIWALARDNGTVVVVDALSSSKEDIGGWAEVRVVGYLKGAEHWPVGSKMRVRTFGGRSTEPPYALNEDMKAGERYVILPDEFFYGKPEAYSPPSDADGGPQISLPRCGLHPDTPEVRGEMEKGFAQNDNLRGPELR